MSMIAKFVEVAPDQLAEILEGNRAFSQAGVRAARRPR